MNRVNVELWEACMIFPDVLRATGQQGSLLQVLQQPNPQSSAGEEGRTESRCNLNNGL